VGRHARSIARPDPLAGQFVPAGQVSPDQFLFASERVVQRRLSHVRPLDYPIYADGMDPLGIEKFGRGIQQSLASGAVSGLYGTPLDSSRQDRSSLGLERPVYLTE